MADLSASSVTVTKIDEDFFGVANKIVINDLKFGDGSLKYPTGGVPLASNVQKFGFQKTIKFAAVQPPHGDGYVYKFKLSDTAPLLRIYRTGAALSGALQECTNAFAPASATTVRVTMIGE